MAKTPKDSENKNRKASFFTKAQNFVKSHRALSIVTGAGVASAIVTGTTIGIVASYLQLHLEVINDVHIVKEGSKANNDYSSPSLKNANDLQDKEARRVSITTPAVEAVNKILTAMNNESSNQWHLLGSPMLDGINAMRYVLMKAANGDQTFKDEADIFTKIAFAGRRLNPSNPNEREIDDWFDGKRGVDTIIPTPASNSSRYDIDALQKPKPSAWMRDLCSFLNTAHNKPSDTEHSGAMIGAYH